MHRSLIIQPSEITLLEELGRGAYAHVHRGTCRGIDVAVKIFKNQTLDDHSPWVREAEMLWYVVLPMTLTLEIATMDDDNRSTIDGWW
jgi:hypothetical protein